MINVGVVGAGHQATDSLIPAIRALEDTNLVAIADVDPRRARDVAERLAIAHFFASLDSMLQVMEIDAIIAACPPQAHEEIARAAIESNTPVFVEKPPAVTTKALQDLAATAAGLITGVGMNFRYATALSHLSDLIATGEYGRPIQVVARHLANKPRDPLWGCTLLRSVLLAQVIHPVDYLLSVLSPLRETQAVTASIGDSITVGLQMISDSNQMASLVSGTASNRFYFGIEVVTDSGAILACDDLWTVSISGVDADRTALGLPWTRRWSPGALDRGYSRTGYLGELRRFLNCVRTNSAFSPSLNDLLPTYEVLDSVSEPSDP